MKSTSFRWARFLAVSSVSLAVGALRAEPPAGVHISTPARSQAAIAALGAHLPTVAKAYGLDAQGFATLLQTHPSLEVDTNGALLSVCDGLTVPASAVAALKKKAGTSDAMTAGSSLTQLAAGSTV